MSILGLELYMPDPKPVLLTFLLHTSPGLSSLGLLGDSACQEAAPHPACGPLGTKDFVFASLHPWYLVGRESSVGGWAGWSIWMKGPSTH